MRRRFQYRQGRWKAVQEEEGDWVRWQAPPPLFAHWARFFEMFEASLTPAVEDDGLDETLRCCGADFETHRAWLAHHRSEHATDQAEEGRDRMPSVPLRSLEEEG